MALMLPRNCCGIRGGARFTNCVIKPKPSRVRILQNTYSAIDNYNGVNDINTFSPLFLSLVIIRCQCETPQKRQKFRDLI
jgi:hypothetical protein